MPPRTKEDEGMHVRVEVTNEGRIAEPVATRHLCAAAVVPVNAVGAAGAACTMRTAKSAVAHSMPSRRRAPCVERMEIFTFPAFLSGGERGGFFIEPFGVVFDCGDAVLGAMCSEFSPCYGNG
jgi:hypothetical protein